jgi:hypothetical protein
LSNVRLSLLDKFQAMEKVVILSVDEKEIVFAHYGTTKISGTCRNEKGELVEMPSTVSTKWTIQIWPVEHKDLVIEKAKTYQANL